MGNVLHERTGTRKHVTYMSCEKLVSSSPPIQELVREKSNRSRENSSLGPSATFTQFPNTFLALWILYIHISFIHLSLPLPLSLPPSLPPLQLFFSPSPLPFPLSPPPLLHTPITKATTHLVTTVFMNWACPNSGFCCLSCLKMAWIMDVFWLPTRDVGKFSCLHKPFNSPSCNRLRTSVGSARCEPTCTCDYTQIEFLSKYDLQDPGQSMESMPLTPYTCMGPQGTVLAQISYMQTYYPEGNLY